MHFFTSKNLPVGKGEIRSYCSSGMKFQLCKMNKSRDVLYNSAFAFVVVVLGKWKILSTVSFFKIVLLRYNCISKPARVSFTQFDEFGHMHIPIPPSR